MLIVTFLLAFLIRLIALNQSLWLDEGTTAKIVQQLNLVQIVTQFSPHDFHPPLYYLLVKIWTYFFGYSEIALRMPSVLFSLGTGWFVYLIGKKLKNQKAGLWAVVFFLFNPLIVYYSQEARMYMLATFLLTGALYYLVEALDIDFLDDGESARSAVPLSSRQKSVSSHLLSFNILIFFSFLTFYGSVFLIAAIYLYLILKKQYRLLLLTLPGFVLALLVVSSLLYRQYLNSREQLMLIVNWRNVLGTVNLKNLLLIPLKFSIGRVSWEPKTVYYALAGLWSVFVFFAVILNLFQDLQSKNRILKQVQNDKLRLLVFLFVTPILLGVVFSSLSPLLQYFRFIYLIPLMALLLAIGATKQWQKVILLTGFTIFSLVYLLNPAFHREDWKRLAQNLNKEKVYMIPSSADSLLYYQPQIQVEDLRNIKNIKEKQIVIIPYTAEIYGYNYQQKLLENNYRLRKKVTFRNLYFEEWSRK